jgi:hypothetical protein
MTQKIMFKKGDLVLYDKFGTRHDSVSPSIYIDDFGVGVVLDIVEEKEGGYNNSCAEIMKDDGSKGFFSLSYLNLYDQ